MYTEASENAACASPMVSWSAASNSPLFFTTRMPLPPPPAAALSSTG
jgi:hypothetical protein